MGQIALIFPRARVGSHFLLQSIQRLLTFANPRPRSQIHFQFSLFQAACAPAKASTTFPTCDICVSSHLPGGLSQCTTLLELLRAKSAQLAPASQVSYRTVFAPNGSGISQQQHYWFLFVGSFCCCCCKKKLSVVREQPHFLQNILPMPMTLSPLSHNSLRYLLALVTSA